MPAKAARARKRRCSASGTWRIWIILDMCKTCMHVLHMSSRLIAQADLTRSAGRRIEKIHGARIPRVSGRTPARHCRKVAPAVRAPMLEVERGVRISVEQECDALLVRRPHDLDVAGHVDVELRRRMVEH